MITVYCLSITLLTLLLEASFHWGADNSHTISVPSKGLRGLHIDLVMAEEQIPRLEQRPSQVSALVLVSKR